MFGAHSQAMDVELDPAVADFEALCNRMTVLTTDPQALLAMQYTQWQQQQQYAAAMNIQPQAFHSDVVPEHRFIASTIGF